MMANYSFTPTSPMGAEHEHYAMDNGTAQSCKIEYHETDLTLTVIISLACVACILGLLGNATVIWLLGFRMKRSPFTTYILNLAVADFGVLLFLIIFFPLSFFVSSDCMSLHVLYLLSEKIFYFMFSVSQFLLTVISIDRCVSVLFPLWYRCHRPEKLSTILCAVIWIFCFLVHGIYQMLYFLSFFEEIHVDTGILFYVFLVNAVICLPLITTSTLILFIRFCLKSQQLRRKKLLLAILLALFFFLFFAFPLNAVFLKTFHSQDDYGFYLTDSHSLCVGFLCASLNSFVNPLIYFLIGRKKRGLCRENLRVILQRVFKQEEEAYGEEMQQAHVPA